MIPACQSHINQAKRSDHESMAFSLERKPMEESAFSRPADERVVPS
jgi:hypothetical protein